MPRGNYYQAGDNYGRAGNYAYQAGGIFSSIGNVLGKVAKVAGAVLPGPIGTIARIGGGILTGAAVGRGIQAALPTLSAPRFAPGGMIPEPGISGVIHRALPGGSSGRGYINKKGEFVEGKRPTMNPMNVRALRRASRRLDSFARTARKALRHSPFMLVSRASRGGRRSPGVITRSEAARALKR